MSKEYQTPVCTAKDLLSCRFCYRMSMNFANLQRKCLFRNLVTHLMPTGLKRWIDID